MGSGKSTVGRILARETGRFFIDSDALIETAENRSIPEIFKTDGEAYYRKRELECFEWMRKSLANSVISTGGGMAYHIEGLGALGKVVYLDVDLETVRQRVASKEAQKRPLAAEAATLEKLYKERLERYRALADIIVDGSGEAEKVALSILRQLA